LFGNLCDESVSIRDEVVECGLVEKILVVLGIGTMKLIVARTISWTINNLLKDPPSIPIELVT